MDETNAAMLAARLAPIDLYRETTIGNRMPSSKLRNPSLLDRTIWSPRSPPPCCRRFMSSFFLGVVSRFFNCQEHVYILISTILNYPHKIRIKQNSVVQLWSATCATFSYFVQKLNIIESLSAERAQIQFCSKRNFFLIHLEMGKYALSINRALVPSSK